MADFYHRSHLLHGFIQPDGQVGSTFSPGGIFYVEIGQIEDQPSDPMTEATRAARLIAEDTDDELWLCLSGGIDSEAMARAFIAAKVPFRVAIMRMSNDLNDFDIRYAVHFCERHELRYDFFDLDIDKFYLDGRHFEIAEKYRCISPQLTTHIELIDRIPGVPILSWNPTFPLRHDSGRLSLSMPKDLYFSYNRYFQKAKRPGIPHFFLYTPELFYSFFSCPTYRKFINQPDLGGFSYSMKCDLYREGGFEIKNRPDKYTGFEKVKLHFAESFDGDPIAFDRRFRHPLQQAYPEHSRLIFRIEPDYLTRNGEITA